jgi:hypothetical protein
LAAPAAEADRAFGVGSQQPPLPAAALEAVVIRWAGMLVKIASGSSSRRLAPFSVSSGATSVMEAGPSAAGFAEVQSASAGFTGFQSPSSAENSASVTIGTA